MRISSTCAATEAMDAALTQSRSVETLEMEAKHAYLSPFDAPLWGRELL